MTDNELDINEDRYNRIPTTTQLIHVLMKIALSMKSANVPFAIELFDTFHFKLLRLNIYDSDQLMEEIHNNKLNDSFESICERTFHQRTIQK